MYAVTDPIMSCYMDEDIGKYLVSDNEENPLPPLSIGSQASSSFTLPVHRLLSPDGDSTFSSDLAMMWGGGERKRVLSVKQETEDDEDRLTPSPLPTREDETDNEDVDMIMPSHDIKQEVQDDFEFDTSSSVCSAPSPMEYKPIVTNRLGMTVEQARRFVEERFRQIAIVPYESLDHRGKIKYILEKSDCVDYTVSDILQFDKTTQGCARACAKIVQNIPQTYRWWCVEPEDIPKCYTIVCDCKKKSRTKPPRPMNAFMIWAQGCRRLINILCPKMQNALISEALGYYWRLKTDAFRDSFGEEKIRIRTFHSVEYPEYKYKPESKSQKILKKQQLNLSKAKARGSLVVVKKEKSVKASPQKSQLGKNGRPKKTASDLSKGVKAVTSRMSVSCLEKGVKSSPTKPAIKDMLTLKIMNDRKSRGFTQLAPVESVSHSFGQLSPLEVESPELGDIFNSSELDPTTMDLGKFGSDRAEDNTMPSSVYDTPANTPPIDADPRQSPIALPLRVSISSPVPLVSSPVPLVSTSETFSISTPNSTTALSTTQALMPSLTAILSSPSVTVPASSSSMPICVLGGLKNACVTRIQPPSLARKGKQQAKTSTVKTTTTNFLLTSVAQALVPLTTQSLLSSSTGTSNFRIVPVLGSFKVEPIDVAYDTPISTLASTTYCSLSTNLGQPPSYASSVPDVKPTLNSQGSVVSNEGDDLDMLSLDLNVPLLTDDDMECLLKSL